MVPFGRCVERDYVSCRRTCVFDEYYVKNNPAAMEKLFAGYVNERLDIYLNILQD